MKRYRGPVSASTKQHGALRAKSTAALVTKSKPPAAGEGGYKINKALPTRKQPRLCYTVTSTPKAHATQKRNFANLTPVKKPLKRNGSDLWPGSAQGRLSLDSEATNESGGRLLNDVEMVSATSSVTKPSRRHNGEKAVMPAHACTSPIAESVSPAAHATVSPPLRPFPRPRSESDDTPMKTRVHLRRRSQSFDGQPSPCSAQPRVDAIMEKIREAAAEERGPAVTRLLAGIEFDVHNLCMRESAIKEEADRLRAENNLFKRRLDSLRRCIEEEQDRTESARKGLQLELFRTQEQLSREREENDALKSRLHQAQLDLEESRITNARLATRRPLRERNLSTGDKTRCGDTEQMLVQSVCRLLLELRLEHPRSRLHHRSSALKDIFRVLDILPAHYDDREESVSSGESPTKPLSQDPTSDRVCLSLTERNLSAHEKHYSHYLNSNDVRSDRLSVCGDENSDSCSTIVPEESRVPVRKNMDICSVTSRLTSSTLSSLQSTEDQQFREGLAKLDAHILSLQTKFNRSASTPYPRRFH